MMHEFPQEIGAEVRFAISLNALTKWAMLTGKRVAADCDLLELLEMNIQLVTDLICSCP